MIAGLGCNSVWYCVLIALLRQSTDWFAMRALCLHPPCTRGFRNAGTETTRKWPQMFQTHDLVLMMMIEVNSKGHLRQYVFLFSFSFSSWRTCDRLIALMISLLCCIYSRCWHSTSLSFTINCCCTFCIYTYLHTYICIGMTTLGDDSFPVF